MASGTSLPTEFDPEPFLTGDLVAAFQRVGLDAGQTVLIHTSMGALGHNVIGGPSAIVDALIQVITPEGTLVMPTHTSDNSEPSLWQHPAVPSALWDRIRQEMPPYRPDATPSTHMGVINECFRQYPGVIRSGHPALSFAAWGKQARQITDDHRLDDGLGEQSPIGRLYALDGRVFLLGVGHARNTSMHLAEYRAKYAGKASEATGAAMMVNGVRQWVPYTDLALDSGDFDMIGAAFEATPGAVAVSKIGAATVRLMRQRPLVDFACKWMEAHRPGSLNAPGQ